MPCTTRAMDASNFLFPSLPQSGRAVRDAVPPLPRSPRRPVRAFSVHACTRSCAWTDRIDGLMWTLAARDTKDRRRIIDCRIGPWPASHSNTHTHTHNAQARPREHLEPLARPPDGAGHRAEEALDPNYLLQGRSVRHKRETWKRYLVVSRLDPPLRSHARAFSYAYLYTGRALPPHECGGGHGGRAAGARGRGLQRHQPLPRQAAAASRGHEGVCVVLAVMETRHE